MAITFTNGAAGFTTVFTGSQTWTDMTHATPSDAATDKLVLQVLGGSYPVGTPPAAVNFTPTNYTKVEVGSGVRTVGTAHTVEVHSYYAKLASAPANLNGSDSGGGTWRTSAIGLIIAGQDLTTPIRAYATNSGYTTGGSGQEITFPDTSSVSDGDMVIRLAFAGHEDDTFTHGTFTGTGSTSITNQPGNGSFRTAMWASYGIKSGAGAPGTATLGFGAAGASRNWIAKTIVIAVAGGGGGSSVAPLATLSPRTIAPFSISY
jgi:hypothetical protein